MKERQKTKDDTWKSRSEARKKANMEMKERNKRNMGAEMKERDAKKKTERTKWKGKHK